MLLLKWSKKDLPFTRPDDSGGLVFTMGENTRTKTRKHLLDFDRTVPYHSALVSLETGCLRTEDEYRIWPFFRQTTIQNE